MNIRYDILSSKTFIKIIILILFKTVSSVELLSFYPKDSSYLKDPGDPLFLTPLIESGQIEKARQLSKVHLNGTKEVSYSGFLTINKTYNSNMFFWFFPARINYFSAPIVLWLQGGPGASSLFGLFDENGPFYINKKYELDHRNISWNQIVNIIYIDNPVGTGFSFTDDEKGYAQNEEDVGKDLYFALIQFLQLFQEFETNDFFVTGESYAGKFIPAISYKIHINNKIHNNNKINLKGFAIGNGLCDPEHMMNYSEYFYQIGLIDYNTKLDFNKKEKEIVKYIKQKDFVIAEKKFSEYFSNFLNLSGFDSPFNFLKAKDDEDPFEKINIFVQKDYVRRSIHVGNLTFNDGNKVGEALENDETNTIKPWLEILVEYYRVIMYNGQLDMVIPYPVTINFLRVLNWSGSEEYKTVIRQRWYIDEELAGYTKTVKNLTEILVRNAGHMVPKDQPKWAFQILKNLVNNVPF